MRLSHLLTCAHMTLRQLGRSRIVLLLLVLIPAVFFGLVALTTTDKTIAFKLASVSEDTYVVVSQRAESLIFIGLAAVGFLTSFVAANLIRPDGEVNRRLVVCGFRSGELLGAKLVVLLGVIGFMGLFIASLLPLFFRPERLVWTGVGILLGGWVYGCYGLLIGALFRRELEAILFIVMLANIDAGWLQNPIYYTEAQNTEIIRALPAYYPSQVCTVAAFSGHDVVRPALFSVLYGFALLIAALVVYRWRMRTFRTA